MVASLAAASCLPLRAVELYNLQFGGSDVGTYQIMFGNPTIQSPVGPFSNALVFHAVTTYDQILLPINVAAPRYDIQYDAFVHNVLNSQYSFAILLDAATVNRLDFHGGLNALSVFQPYPYTLENVSGFANDQAYHFDISVDLGAHQWTIALDGVQVYSNAFLGTSLEDIRFGMGPWIGGAVDAPDSYAALDNVVVTAVPEPRTGFLGILSLITWLGAKASLREQKLKAKDGKC